VGWGDRQKQIPFGDDNQKSNGKGKDNSNGKDNGDGKGDGKSRQRKEQRRRLCGETASCHPILRDDAAKDGMAEVLSARLRIRG
jgi:hypothetical protein